MEKSYYRNGKSGTTTLQNRSAPASRETCTKAKRQARPKGQIPSRIVGRLLDLNSYIYKITQADSECDQKQGRAEIAILESGAAQKAHSR